AVFLGQGVGHLRDLGDQALRDLAYLARDLSVARQRLLLLQDLLVGLQAEGLLVLGGDVPVDQYRLAGIRIDAAVGDPVVRGIGGERQQDPPAQAAAPPRCAPVANRI